VKSICIKTDNKSQIEYLIEKLEKLSINIYISSYRFKIYDNVIVHYKESDTDGFYRAISLVIKECVEEFYEDNIIMKNIKQNYFYLNRIEQEYILNITLKVLKLPDSKIGYKNETLRKLIEEYIRESKSIIIDGFVNFRIKRYKEILENIIEVSVFSYLDLTYF